MEILHFIHLVAEVIDSDTNAHTDPRIHAEGLWCVLIIIIIDMDTMCILILSDRIH